MSKLEKVQRKPGKGRSLHSSAIQPSKNTKFILPDEIVPATIGVPGSSEVNETKAVLSSQKGNKMGKSNPGGVKK